MQEGTRWIVAILAVAAILALLLLARGPLERGNPDTSPSAVSVEIAPDPMLGGPEPRFPG